MPSRGEWYEREESPEKDLECRGAGGRRAAIVPTRVVREGCPGKMEFEERLGEAEGFVALCRKGLPGRGHGTQKGPEERGAISMLQELQRGQGGGVDDEIRRKQATSLGGLHTDLGFEQRSVVIGQACTACLASGVHCGQKWKQGEGLDIPALDGIRLTLCGKPSDLDTWVQKLCRRIRL